MKQFYGSWIRGATSGGCINHIDTFANNPQFLIELCGSKADYTCVMGLIQKSAKNAGSGKIGSLQIGKISKSYKNLFCFDLPCLGWIGRIICCKSTGDQKSAKRELLKKFGYTYPKSEKTWLAVSPFKIKIVA